MTVKSGYIKSRDAAVKALSVAFNDTEYSDLTVKCKGVSFSCHKVILCRRVKFFEGSCKSSMIESQTNEIDMGEEHPEVVESLLRYIYTSTLENEKLLKPGNRYDTIDQLCHAARLYGLAEKFAIPELKKFIYDWISEKFDFPESTTLDEFVQVVPIVYSTTPDWDRCLRDDCIVQIADCDMKEDGARQVLKQLLQDNPEFAVEFGLYWLQDELECPGGFKTFNCDECGEKIRLLAYLLVENRCYYCGGSVRERKDDTSEQDCPEEVDQDKAI